MKEKGTKLIVFLVQVIQKKKFKVTLSIFLKEIIKQLNLHI